MKQLLICIPKQISKSHKCRQNIFEYLDSVCFTRLIVGKVTSCKSIVQYRQESYRKSTIYILERRHWMIAGAAISFFRAESYSFEVIVCNSLQYIFASSDGRLIREVATPVFMN